MPVDNEIYNAPGDIWWDENQPLHVLRTALNPARMQYFTSFSLREAWTWPGKSPSTSAAAAAVR